MIYRKLCACFIVFSLACLSAGKVFAVCTDDGLGNIVCAGGESVFTGDTAISTSLSINDGMLSLTPAASLTGNFIFNFNGGTFKTEGVFSFDNEVNFGGGNINVDGEESILSFRGLASGSTFTKSGLGLLELSGSAAYGGNINILEGALETNAASFTGNAVVNEEAFLIFSENTDNAFSGTLSGGGNFIKDGAGILTIDGSISADTDIEDGALSISSSNNLTGNISINKGSLKITDDVMLNKEISFGAQNEGVDVAAGKTLVLGSGAVIHTQGCDGANCSQVIKNGAGTLVIDGGATGRYFADTYIKQGVLQIANGASLGDTGFSVSIGDAALLITEGASVDNLIEVLTNTSTLSISNGKNVTLEADTYGSGVLNKTGQGVLFLGSGRLNHDGGTIISEGALQGSSSNLFGNIEVASAADLNILQSADGTFSGALSGGGAVNKQGAGILTLSGANASFSGIFNVEEGSIKGSSSAINSEVILAEKTSVIFEQNCAGAACEYNNTVSGGGSLVKTGSGLLVLNGTNTYLGGTYLQNSTRDAEGILFSADSALGALQSDIFISKSNLTLLQNSIVSTDRNFTFSSLENSITVQDNSVYTINGILQGTSFSKLGNGELILTADNTFTGGAQVTEGTLSVYNSSSLGRGILALTGGEFKNLADMDIANNIYLGAAAGQGGFNVGGGETLTLNGILSGSGALTKKGAGVLDLTYYNSYLGGVYVEEGLVRGNSESIVGDITILSSAEVEFKQNFEGMFIGDIDSAGTITKTGSGTLYVYEDDALPGALSMGTLNINEGALVAKNALNANALVASGALLSLEQGGSGAFETYGTLLLAQSGAADLTGDITVKTGGVLAVSVEEGLSSKLNLNNLTVEDGGKINITAKGIFQSPASFDFLTYSGAFNGVLENIDITVANNRRLSAAVQDGGGTLSLLISRILSNYSALSGLTYNQTQVASALDRASAAPSADLEQVLNAIDDLPVAERPSALVQAGGFIYANLPNYFKQFKDNAYLRINRAPAEEETFSRNIWVESVNNYSDVKANNNSSDIYNLSNGFVFGFDKYFKDAALTAGLFAGYAHHNLKHNEKAENLDGDEYQFGLYLLKQGEVLDFKGALSAAYQTDSVERRIAFAARRAKGKLKSYGANIDLEGGVKIFNIGSFTLRPFAGLSASVNKISSFEESGADSINISSDGSTVFLTQGTAGIGVEKRGKSFSYYADFSAKQNLNTPEVSLNLAGESYKVKAADYGALLGVNIGGVKRFSESISVYADGGADINGTAQNYYLNIGLRSYW